MTGIAACAAIQPVPAASQLNRFCCSVAWRHPPLPPAAPRSAGGALRISQDIGIFKNDASPEWLLFSPTAVTYLLDGLVDGRRPEPSSGSGMSAGAIAGIATAAAAAVVAAAAGAVWLARRRRLGRRRAVGPAKPDAGAPEAEAEADSAYGSMEAAQPGPGDGGGQEPKAAQLLPAMQQPQQPLAPIAELGRASSGLVSPFSAAASGDAFPSRTSSKRPSPAGSATSTASGKLAAALSAAATAPEAAAGAARAEPPPRAFSVPPPRAATRPLLHPTASAAVPLSPSISRLQTPDQGPSQPLRPPARHVSFHLTPAQSAANRLTSGSSLASPGAATGRFGGIGALSHATSGSTAPSCSSAQRGSADALPELVAHAAAQEELAGSLSGASGSSSDEQHRLVGVEDLPERLRGALCFLQLGACLWAAERPGGWGMGGRRVLCSGWKPAWRMAAAEGGHERAPAAPLLLPHP